MRKRIAHGLSYLCVFLLCISISAGAILEYYSTAVDTALGTTSSAVIAEGGETYTAFVPDEQYLNEDGTGNSAALIQGAINLDRKMVVEGAVLLKNENNTLPLEGGSDITLMGIRSYYTLLGCATGNTVENAYISLYDALGSKNVTDFNNIDNWVKASKYVAGMTEFQYDGAGFNVNPTMLEVYKAVNATDSFGLTVIDEPSVADFDPNEPSLLDLAAAGIDYSSSIQEYNDAVIVTVGRPSDEGRDYGRGTAGTLEGTGATDPLGLTNDEREIINYACENFDKVIVLVNTACMMEIGELADNDEIDAIMWIGFPGNYGTLGIADLLVGKETPSGALSDIYVEANLSSPATVNLGLYYFANEHEIDRSSSDHYLIEAEGIYVGYRYYETRYYDCIANPESNAGSNAGVYASTSGWKYDEEVVYGFGYGDSYTTFSQTIDKVDVTKEEHNFTMDFTVTVTNTGDTYSGKSIVQVYAQAPYEDGMVEKSSIQLMGYGKTKELAPGETETIVVSIDLQNLASYDDAHDNGDGTYGTYILDAGNYYFALGNGAHDALNNVLSAQGYTVEDGMDYEGDASKVYLYEDITEYDDKTFSVTKNGVTVSNQLEFADWNKFEDTEDIVYLSRSDWEGTYPVEYTDMSATASMMDDLNGLVYDLVTTDDTSGVKWGVSSGITFYDMFDIAYDDERWDAILAQMTFEEAIIYHMFNGPCLPGIVSLELMSVDCIENSGNGITITLGGTKDTEAPWAISTEDENATWNGEVLACMQLVASSFNDELAYEVGQYMGNEGLFLGVTVVWGPGGNTIRTPYNGRSGDYFSEDGVLAGYIMMEYAMGALDKGLIAAPKHFAFNDQELGRTGLATFISEQRAREVELRAFQIPIEATKYDELRGEDMGMLGMMTSLGKIGTQECSSSYGLMTGILRQEWGFKGYATSDGGDDLDMFVSTATSGLTGHDLRGATDSAFAVDYKGFKSQANGVKMKIENLSGDINLMNCLKQSAKNDLYTFARSNMINRYSAEVERVEVMTSWRIAYYSAIGTTAVLSLVCVVLYLAPVKKRKEEKED